MMPIDATQIATEGASKLYEFGLLGVFTVCLMAFILYIVRMHKEERTEWRDDANRRDEQVSKSSEKLADAIAQLSRDIHSRRD